MGKALLPQAFWFRLSTPCPRVEEIPCRGARGGLLDLPATCAVPDLSSLEGSVAWASVRLAWNPQGLGIAILADAPASKAARSADRPERFADVNLWIDTRDTRNVSRATRFCHRFTAHLILRTVARAWMSKSASARSPGPWPTPRSPRPTCRARAPS